MVNRIILSGAAEQVKKITLLIELSKQKLTKCLKHKGERVSVVFCSEGDDVFISSALQDF